MAESASDFMQGTVMFFSLLAVLIAGISVAGGISAVAENVKEIPGFFDFFGIAQPIMSNGVQRIGDSGKPLFGAAGSYGLLTIISTLSWGLGYFGMPQVLLKFMAIRKTKELTLSRRVATIWCAISLTAAVAIGIIGRALYPDAFLTQSASENIFILMSTNFFIPLFAGVVMAGILAATISSSDSYLLIAASAFSKSLYQGIMKKDASDKAVLFVTRITLLVKRSLRRSSLWMKTVSFLRLSLSPGPVLALPSDRLCCFPSFGSGSTGPAQLRGCWPEEGWSLFGSYC